MSRSAGFLAALAVVLLAVLAGSAGAGERTFPGKNGPIHFVKDVLVDGGPGKDKARIDPGLDPITSIEKLF